LQKLLELLYALLAPLAALPHLSAKVIGIKDAFIEQKLGGNNCATGQAGIMVTPPAQPGIAATAALKRQGRVQDGAASATASAALKHFKWAAASDASISAEDYAVIILSSEVFVAGNASLSTGDAADQDVIHSRGQHQGIRFLRSE
jgi:hypothetical protein